MEYYLIWIALGVIAAVLFWLLVNGAAGLFHYALLDFGGWGVVACLALWAFFAPVMAAVSLLAGIGLFFGVRWMRRELEETLRLQQANMPSR
ncbi:hypothetical protein [uncultured Roseobacter sp.]|uniref:hypothetical protein n=1 Tax=uncultured Roseobacter sp. TaxID=114847 RepID=UPI00261624CA|nr:hypothetical protein [uncultured Roseobacter sp.]